MAVSGSNLSGLSKGSDLTDEQLDRLLAQATARRLKKVHQDTVATSTKTHSLTFPKLDTGKLDRSYVSTRGGVTTIDSTHLVQQKQRQQEPSFRKVDDPITAKLTALEKKNATAGPGWFDLPKTNLTPELKRDLQMIKMRNVLDPHRHYKKDGGKMKAPEFSQVGTVIEGPTEFFSGRIENKKRKRTFVEEVLAGEQQTGRFKKKYVEMQGRKTSGKKAFYKALKDNRRGGVKKGAHG